MSWTAQDLDGMKTRELVQVGRTLGLHFNKNHNAAERRNRILAAQAESESVSLPSQRPHEALPLEVTEAKPGFENLIQSNGADPGVMAGRGGERPGAGRPIGTTADIAAVRRLPDVPHPVVKDLLEGLFELWAKATKCPEVALTKEEAVDLALPWTQALELVGVTQKIPPWLSVMVCGIWTTATIVKSKAKLAREAALGRKVNRPAIGAVEAVAAAVAEARAA